MREIKFRGKRIDNGEWAYGYYVGGVSTDNHSIVYADKENFYCQDEVIPETVGQYTGLKDKTGTEIYEGDIMRYDDANYGYGGSYDKTHDGYKRTVIPSIPKMLGPDWDCESYWIIEWEVIGNIHENPELLKE